MYMHDECRNVGMLTVVDPGISEPGPWSRRGRILRVWGLFLYAPSHIPYVFVVRVEKNAFRQHNMLTTIFYTCYAVKIIKTAPPLKKSQKGAGGAPVLGLLLVGLILSDRDRQHFLFTQAMRTM